MRPSGDNLHRDLEKGQEQTVNVAQFVALVKRYTVVSELTPIIVVNKFIERILIHAPDKSSGRRVQDVEIIYNLVGKVEKSPHENSKAG